MCGGIVSETSIIDVQIDDDNCSSHIVEELEDKDIHDTDNESYDDGVSDDGGR